jgi:hypothetical protein
VDEGLDTGAYSLQEDTKYRSSDYNKPTDIGQWTWHENSNYKTSSSSLEEGMFRISLLHFFNYSFVFS